jgi:hypothetical protein
MATCLDAALAYRAAGYRVLPLKGKAPDGRLVPHGVDDATVVLCAHRGELVTLAWRGAA